ncbi:MAG: transposase [Desulfobacterales bacterium]|nr:transposase [Desulfobacterales bacterium]
MTREQRNWLHFGFYVTNVERDVWSAKVIGTIYRIRWRIELIFKSWKSLLRLHVLKGTRPERIRCFLYGRLITVTIMTMLYAYANWYAEHIHKREVSAHKLYNWLKRRNRIGKAIFSGIMDILITTLNRDILRNCKQKRKRKTSLELIVEKVPYMESFDQNNMISQDISN